MKFYLYTIMMLTTICATETAAIDYFEYEPDTSNYTTNILISIVPGPNDPHSVLPGAGGVPLWASKRKSGSTLDIFTFSGVVGTITLPPSLNFDRPLTSIYCSNKIIDSDNGWECIFNYHDDIGYFFMVFDSDGTKLLADSGRAVYGYDGSNTYVMVNTPNFTGSYNPSGKTKMWRFQTNNASSDSPSLAKTRTPSGPSVIMTLGATGDYRVVLEPSGGGKTTVQMFDMMGRLLFEKDAGDLNKRQTFTIPASGIPPTPFISRVKDNHGSVEKKEIPVR